MRTNANLWQSGSSKQKAPRVNRGAFLLISGSSDNQVVPSGTLIAFLSIVTIGLPACQLNSIDCSPNLHSSVHWKRRRPTRSLGRIQLPQVRPKCWSRPGSRWPTLRPHRPRSDKARRQFAELRQVGEIAGNFRGHDGRQNFDRIRVRLIDHRKASIDRPAIGQKQPDDRK